MPSPVWTQARLAGSPETVNLVAVEITHPDLPAPARAISDTIEHQVEGNLYLPVTFAARLADDTEDKAPRAELTIDNVGHVLTQWVELSKGGAGATLRLMQVIDDTVEWEVTLDVANARVTYEQVIITVGFQPLLARPAVQVRHDPTHSPGLF